MSFFSRFFPQDKRPSFPKFTYHPDPIATGALKRKAARCPCCEKTTDFVYGRSPYCTDEVEDLCPWCIADGSAARKFDASFVDDHPLAQAGLKSEIIDEVAHRTPGYISWQQESWLTCCEDACEFHGDLRKEELPILPADTLVAFRTEHRIDDRVWEQLLESYEPGGSPSIYKFVCRHCRKIHLGFDFD
jgi:uncharacterized protein CbrC (UPF0167 family)